MKLASAGVDSNPRPFTTRIRVGHHELVADEHGAQGGTDAGPAPYGLLLSALGACTSITLRMYAERKGWQLGTIRVVLKHTKHHDGSDLIEREVSFGAPLDDQQRARMADIVEKTPVTKTIKNGAAITTRLL